MPTRSFAKLDMYLSASTEPLFNALEDWMREACGDFDQYHDLAGVAFGQICGIEFAKADAGTYSYLATLSLADKSAPAGYYHSVLITLRQGGLEKLEDFDPARHKVAINELGSFSGSVVFSSHMLGRGDAGFPRHVLSGGHAKSVQLVAEGKVKLAAIDRLSFNMAIYEQPELIQHIRVLGQTGDYPGLPFVAPGNLPADQVEHMIQHLLGFAETEAFQQFAPRLGVGGILRLDDPSRYAEMARL